MSGYKVKVYVVDHNKVTCLGYTFEDESGNTVGFSGDTRECVGLHKILNKADVAFVDMAAMYPVKAHLDCNNFVKLQEQYPDCKMYPVHMSDDCRLFAEENNLNVLNDFDEIII